MSTYAQTKEYATEVAEAALNAFEKQARGTLSAPGGAENVKLFTAKGGSAVTLASTTTSAAVIFDPEASLRNGQMSVLVHERDSSDGVTNVQKLNLGRASEEFISAGVLSSGLKVFNSSGVDVIGGTQSAAVLSSVPRKASTITSTDLSNFCPNHERDLASGVVSREDATMTMALTSHYGQKMCLARSNTQGNVIRRSWDDGVGSRRTTVGQALGPTTDLSYAALSNSSRTTAQILADQDQSGAAFAGRHLIDTDNLDEANNPLTLATYSVEFRTDNMFNTGDVADTDFRHEVVALALDAANNVIVSKEMRIVRNMSAVGINLQMVTSGTLTSTTVPIARLVVAVRAESANQSTSLIAAGQSHSVVTAIEETADIPARGIHFCVFEGLNASATININSFAVLTGVPDSTNVFISSGTQSSDDVHDYNAVEIFLRSISNVLPRAFTVGGHGEFTRELKTMYGDEETSVAFKAMSFAPLARRIKSSASVAKRSARDAAMMAKKVLPYAEAAGEMLSVAPGPIGAAGSAMVSGAEMARRMRLM